MRIHKVDVGRYTLHIFEVGNPDGTPAVILHGGPGSGSDPNKANIFDLAKYRVFLIDQRGAGESEPSAANETDPASLHDNTTDQLIEDFHYVKAQLEIQEPWLVAGNSFGATLALLYSIRFPADVREMLLWGTFLCRDSDLSDMFQPGGSAAIARPNAYNEFLNHLPFTDRTNPVPAYTELLWSADGTVREDAAWEWARWNRQLYYSQSKPEAERTPHALTTAVTFARLVQYYFASYMFLPNVLGASADNNQILENVSLIPDVPIQLLHGEVDLAVPLDGAVKLNNALNTTQRINQSSLEVVKGASHSTSEPGYLRALQLATR